MARCFRKNAKIAKQAKTSLLCFPPRHTLTNRRAKLKQAIFIALSRLNMQPRVRPRPTKIGIGKREEGEEDLAPPLPSVCCVCSARAMAISPSPFSPLLYRRDVRFWVVSFLNLELVRYAVRSGSSRFRRTEVELRRARRRRGSVHSTYSLQESECSHCARGLSIC